MVELLLDWDPFDQANPQDMVDEHPGTAEEKATALWAAFAEGRYAAGDPLSYPTEQRLSALYARSLLREAPNAPTPEQLRYALRRLAQCPQSVPLLFICSYWIHAAAPAIHKALAGELPPVLIEHFIESRFSVGAPHDSFFSPDLFGPSFAERCRIWLANRVDNVLTYDRFSAVPAVVPAGHPDSAKIVLGYWGPSWLSTTMAFLRERGLEGEVIEVIDRHVQRVPPWHQPPTQLVDGWMAATLLGLVLRHQAGLPVSAALTQALTRPPATWGRYSLDGGKTDGEERASIRAAAAHFGPSISAALARHHVT